MPIVLYKVNSGPPSRGVLMAVEIIGLNLETKDVVVYLREHLAPEFVAKNPLHTVPFLEDGNFSLADSHAIMTYLVTKYGADKKSTLYPDDVETRSTIDQRMYMESSIAFPALSSIVMSIVFKKATGPSEEQVKNVKEVYGFLEKYLERTKFLAADHVTLADISLVSTVSTVEGVVPIEGFPKLTDWFNTMKSFDWYQKANAPGNDQFLNFLKQHAEKNKA